jgi:hypothetical protein
VAREDKKPKAKKGNKPSSPGPRAYSKGVDLVKGPRARLHTESAEGRPLISFQYADRQYDGEWSWPTGEEAHVVLDALIEFSKSTWAELATQQTGPPHKRRPKHHSEPLGALCKEAQGRLSDLHLDEIVEEELFRFRLTGTGRLWGIKIGHVFYVLWWDRDHKVRPL